MRPGFHSPFSVLRSPFSGPHLSVTAETVRVRQLDVDSFTTDNSTFFDPVMIDGKRQLEIVSQPFDAPLVQTSSARDAYTAVLASVGASLPRRDSVDARIINEVKSGTGSIIDSQEQVGSWPELKSTTPPVDTDEDGMPDSWERRFGLNPRDPSDGAADKDHDGYTNLEEYLNNTNPRK